MKTNSSTWSPASSRRQRPPVAMPPPRQGAGVQNSREVICLLSSDEEDNAEEGSSYIYFPQSGSNARNRTSANHMQHNQSNNLNTERNGSTLPVHFPQQGGRSDKKRGNHPPRQPRKSGQELTYPHTTHPIPHETSPPQRRLGSNGRTMTTTTAAGGGTSRSPTIPSTATSNRNNDTRNSHGHAAAKRPLFGKPAHRPLLSSPEEGSSSPQRPRTVVVARQQASKSQLPAPPSSNRKQPPQPQQYPLRVPRSRKPPLGGCNHRGGYNKQAQPKVIDLAGDDEDDSTTADDKQQELTNNVVDLVSSPTRNSFTSLEEAKASLLQKKRRSETITIDSGFDSHDDQVAVIKKAAARSSHHQETTSRKNDDGSNPSLHSSPHQRQRGVSPPNMTTTPTTAAATTPLRGSGNGGAPAGANGNRRLQFVPKGGRRNRAMQQESTTSATTTTKTASSPDQRQKSLTRVNQGAFQSRLLKRPKTDNTSTILSPSIRESVARVLSHPQHRAVVHEETSNPVAFEQTAETSTGGASSKRHAAAGGSLAAEEEDVDPEIVREPASKKPNVGITGTQPAEAELDEFSIPKQAYPLTDSDDADRKTDSKSPDSTVPELDTDPTEDESPPARATPTNSETDDSEEGVPYPAASDMYDRVGKRKRNAPDRFSYAPTEDDSSMGARVHNANSASKSSKRVALPESSFLPALEPSKEKAELLQSYDALFPREPARDTEMIHVRNLEPLGELKFPQITPIEHLAESYVDAYGLPVREMFLHGGNDGILYQIRLNAAKSKFKGYGAFLTYLGAWKVEESLREIGERMIKKRAYFASNASQGRDVTDLDGWEKNFRVTGEDIHGNGNNFYWPPSVAKEMDETQSLLPEMIASPSGRAIVPDDEEDERDVKVLESRLMYMKQKGLKPIGHLGLYCIEDYKPTRDVPFDLTGVHIDIGRYGPFSNKDRKPLSNFELKCFLFKNEPQLYPFEAEKSLDGEVQIIDVTDDVTGLPHNVAKANITMYVNEVGHDLENKQLVFSHASGDQRSCHYSVVLEDGSSMSAGSKVELLTSYFHTYESVREREGYGLKNMYHKLASVDDQARRIQLGIYDREDVEWTLRSLDPFKFADAVERLEQMTCQPLQRLFETFFDSNDLGTITPLQLVACRRIGWLRHMCLSILRSKEADLDKQTPEQRNWFQYPELRRVTIRQSRASLDDWKMHPYLSAGGRTDTRILQNGAVPISDALRLESQEDICFELREQLKEAFNPSVWCAIARDLMSELCDAVHFSDFLPWTDPTEIIDKSQSKFEKAVLESFAEAARLVREAATEQSSALNFDSGLTEDHVIKGSISDILSVYRNLTAEHLDCCHDAAYVDCITSSKLFTCEVLCRLSYLESLRAAGGKFDQHYNGKELNHQERTVMAKAVHTGQENPLNKIRSMPRPVSSGGHYIINVEWYLLWQVAFPVLAFVERYIPSRVESIKSALCKEENLEHAWIDYALKSGIRDTSNAFEKVCVPKRKLQWKKVSPFHLHKSGATRTQLAEIIVDDDIVHIQGLRSNTKRQRRGQPRLSLEELCGGKRPAGSGRDGITEEQMLLALDIGDTRKFGPGATATSTGRPIPKMVWAGVPDEKFFDGGEPINWPGGWTKRVYQRASGDTKGATDRYWFTPIEQYKLRSKKEVARFFDCMEACDQDERRAWNRFKERR